MMACFASSGYKVIGVDTNKNFVSKVNSGLAPVSEPGLAELIKKNRKLIRGTDNFQDAVSNSQITFVIVPTPSKKDGSFSTDFAVKAADAIGKALKHKTSYHLVVLTSTVLPGSTEEKVIPALEKSSGKKAGVDFGVCYSPLFIAIGNVVENIFKPDFVLIGETDPASGKTLMKFYETIVQNKAPITRMNIVSAELTKISINVYITNKISYANTLAEVSEKLKNVDLDKVTEAVGLDTRIGPKYLKGGLGFGGPCFPRDNIAFIHLANKIGSSAPLLAQASDKINKRQPDRLVDKALSSSKGKRFSILGLAYKTNTHVTEESQGLQIAKKLVEIGKEVTAYDPMISESPDKKIILAKSLKECTKNADVIIITLPYKEFRLNPNQIKKGAVVIDCWRIHEPKHFKGRATHIRVGSSNNI